MPELRIDAAEELVKQLRLRAKAERRSVEEIILEDLRKGSAAVAAVPGSGEEGVDPLAALAETKLGPTLARLARPVPAERREDLARKACVGKPLSQVIIEDRGQ